MMHSTRDVERRCQPRAEVLVSAVALAEGRYAGQYLLINVSEGGALVAGNARLAVDEVVRLAFRLPGLGAVSLQARVVRADGLGPHGHYFALAFADAPENMRIKIRALVASVHEAMAPQVLVCGAPGVSHQSLRRDLDALDAETVVARTPLDVVVELQRGHHRFAAAVIDVSTAGWIDVVRVLEEEHPEIPRVVLYGDEQDTLQRSLLREHRVHAAVRIPWQRQSLRATLHLAANHH